MKLGNLARTSHEITTRLENRYRDLSNDKTIVRKLTQAVLALGLTSTLTSSTMSLFEKHNDKQVHLSAKACNLAVINCISGNIINFPTDQEEIKAGDKRQPSTAITNPKPKENTQQPAVADIAPKTILIPTPEIIKKAGTQSIHPSVPEAYPGKIGVDISWPPSNCSAEIPGDAAFGIVGVNGGRNLTLNSCLKSEAEKFKNPSLYVNTGFPGYEKVQEYKDFRKNCELNDVNCYAYNYGFASGKYAVEQANAQEIKSPVWWLDVETANSWSNNQNENSNSIQGEIDAIVAYNKEYNDIEVAIGIYSTQRMWRNITNNWQNGLPNWVASGTNNPADALKKCTDNNFTGGQTIMSQYVQDNLDKDIVC